MTLCLAAVVAVVAIRSTILRPEAVVSRPYLSYEAENGSRYAYPIGYDSYGWLRMARNHLGTGSACDAVIDGVCRDELGAAPAGATMLYADSWHIPALGALHRVLAFFDLKIPLEASALWLQVIVAALAALPAFHVGRRISGPLGGFVAALLASTNLYVLMRSENADNDIWNVSLPILVASFVVESLVSDGRRRVIFAALAAATVSLQAAIWSGWLFIYVVAVASLCGALGIVVVRATLTSWPALPRLKHTAGSLVGAILIVTGSIVVTQDVGEIAQRLPVVRDLFGAANAAPLAAGPRVLHASFATPLADVQELQQADAGQLFDDVGGALWVGSAWFGLLLLTLWRCEPARLRFLALGAGGLVYALLSWMPDVLPAGRAIVWWTPFLLALGLAVVRSTASVGELGSLLLLGLWASAAFHLSAQAPRFLLLYAPALGLMIGAAAGRVLEEVRHRMGTSAVAGWIAVAAALALVAQPTLRAWQYSQGRVPRMNDAWRSALARVEEELPCTRRVWPRW